MQRYDLQSIYYGIKEHSNIVPKNCFEVGSRDGHDCVWIANQFGLPVESCYIFEPIPKLCHEIIRQYPTANTFNNAVSDKEGNVKFTVEAENIGASSLYERVNPLKDNEVIEVETVTMENVIDSLNIESIDIMKLDVEGHALAVLKGFGKHLDKLQSLEIELEHQEIWDGQTLYPEVKQWLEEHGFVQIMFTLLRGIQSDSFWVRKDRMIL